MAGRRTPGGRRCDGPVPVSTPSLAVARVATRRRPVRPARRRQTVELIDACDLVGAREVTIVCPGIARPGWARHFETCQQIPRSIAIIENSKDAVRCSADVRIVSYALLAKPMVRDALRERQPKAAVLIADEAHNSKASTQRALQRSTAGQD